MASNPVAPLSIRFTLIRKKLNPEVMVIALELLEQALLDELTRITSSDTMSPDEIGRYSKCISLLLNVVRKQLTILRTPGKEETGEPKRSLHNTHLI